MKVVDLGSKTGGSLDYFCKNKHHLLSEVVADTAANQCLATDKTDRYKSAVEAKGYKFQQIDLCDVEQARADLPEADYYLAWDLLEHLPSKAVSDAVVLLMLQKARKAVWLRMPSFEQDAHNGEGVLKPLGLRFCWTTWNGHKTHYLLSDALAAIGQYRHCTKPEGLYNVLVVPGRGGIYPDTKHSKIVPIEADGETSMYDSETMATKPNISFDPPVIGQWDVLVVKT